MKGTVRLLLVLCVVLFIRPSAHASVFFGPAPPDARLSFPLKPAEYDTLRDQLLVFAKDEKFILFNKVPRARGKVFFVSLNRSDTILIIAEKRPSDDDVNIELSNVNGGASDFAAVESRLVKLLRKNWPGLKIVTKDDRDRY